MRKIAAPYTDPSPLFRHGGAPQRDRGQLLDFSASINPLGPPESVLRTLRDELPNIAHYPDPESQELTERLAVLHGVAPSQVVVGNGSNELIYAIARAFRPKRVAIAEPTYTEYLRASLAVGAEVDHWLAEGDRFIFEPFDPGDASVVWLCDPNSPTGSIWSGDLLAWFRQHPRTVFVVDEAFLPLCWRKFYSSNHSFISGSLGAKVAACPNLIVLRSFTKWYALPGLRLGYALGSAETCAYLRSQLVPWSTNALAQAAAVCLDDRNYENRTNEWLAHVAAPVGDSPGFAEQLSQISPQLRPVASDCNFVLVRLENRTATELCSGLERHGIRIRNAGNFIGLDEHYVRIAARTAQENDRLSAALRSLLRG